MVVDTAVNLSRAVYFPKLHDTQSAFKISVFADIVEAKSLINKPREKGLVLKRNIHGFSSQSRHAMIEFLAKIVDSPDLFVTLTYSDDIAEDWYLTLRENFEAFRKRLEYHYEGIRAMWRVEFVPRKSGKLTGMFIPHLHLLVWLPDGVSQARKEKILQDDGALWRTAWHEITGSNNSEHLRLYGCKVEEIKSRKHAYAYCSKYLAKETMEDIEFGRRWGRIGKFEQPAFTTELTQREYFQFKRILNAYLKADALKRFHAQKPQEGEKRKKIGHYLKFWKFFKRMNSRTGSSVFGLGFISQGEKIDRAGNLTIDGTLILKMIEHAKDIAFQKEQERIGVTFG